MRLIDSNERLEGAGLCFICETAVRHPQEPVIATAFLFDPPYQSPLVGTKYICHSCADTMARVMGYIPMVEMEQAITLGIEAKNDLLHIQDLAQRLVLTAQGLPEPAKAGAVTVTKEKHGVKA